MFSVITSPCIGRKEGACTKVCPVNCFYDAGEQLMIHPEECTVCGLCTPECPVSAIFPSEEVPAVESAFIQKARDFFAAKTPEELDAIRVKP